MHYPKDDKAITRLQDETNKTYLISVEKILNRSKISTGDKKEILSKVIRDETYMINSI